MQFMAFAGTELVNLKCLLRRLKCSQKTKFLFDFVSKLLAVTCQTTGRCEQRPTLNETPD